MDKTRPPRRSDYDYNRKFNIRLLEDAESQLAQVRADYRQYVNPNKDKETAMPDLQELIDDPVGKGIPLLFQDEETLRLLKEGPEALLESYNQPVDDQSSTIDMNTNPEPKGVTTYKVRNLRGDFQIFRLNLNVKPGFGR